MRKITAILACLAVAGIQACGSTSTAPEIQHAVEARTNGGLLGSGYNTAPGDSTARGGGLLGSGYDTAPLADSTGRYGGMAGSGY